MLKGFYMPAEADANVGIAVVDGTLAAAVARLICLPSAEAQAMVGSLQWSLMIAQDQSGVIEPLAAQPIVRNTDSNVFCTDKRKGEYRS
jgi:hypothetical protein